MIAHITIILSFQALLKAYSPHKFLHRGRQKKPMGVYIIQEKEDTKIGKGTGSTRTGPLNRYLYVFILIGYYPSLSCEGARIQAK